MKRFVEAFATASRRSLLATTTLACLAACIPEDTTIARGGIALHFDPSETMARGAEFTTADGWHVIIEKAIVSLEALPGDGCNYKEADFGGILYDARYPLLTVIRGAEAKECKYFVAFRGGLRSPRLEGADEADRLLLTQGKDALEVPYAIHYVGSGSYGKETVRFDFGVAISGLALKFAAQIPEDDKVDSTFIVKADEIFRTGNPGSVGPFAFTPIWLADQRGNKDGVVTNDELDKLRVSRLGAFTPGSELKLSDYFSQRAMNMVRIVSINVGEPKEAR
ncbi:MAG: hypothetical protein U0174_01050 [Polyangiaceae bacterium]